MKPPLKAFIVDDESLARKGLALRLEPFEQVQLIGESGNSRDALEQIVELSPDVVFVDIQMPGLNGFELLRELQQRVDNLPAVVFVTAFDHYAIRAFEVRALDYLLKPVDEERLAETLERVQQELAPNSYQKTQQKLVNLVSEVTGQQGDAILEQLARGADISELNRYPEHIAIKDSGEITRVPVNSIEWVDAAGDYMCIHAAGETFILRRTMKELEQELNPNRFQRVHRSAIVNIDQVEKLCTRHNGEYHLVLKNGQNLKVSRSYKDRIKQLILS
ncbi:LytTR family two component transcriptional regulator [Idiomarina aquatica]|uniref:LytTR family two component transcriptional regulator n=1 Tax=Idiomarina aquatica TaxID=1327752 RepID=A0A4R6PPM9_9GAMM|nr:LytTR family DNA-binding domain-containing protein [Idiomarina aquatica]TDP40665.1 LytTR family two component transcriptional regulator [Idiomarina aquatica]